MDSAESYFMRSHKDYITYYNFEAVGVKFKFPLYIITSGGSGGSRLLTKAFKKIKKCNFMKTNIDYMHSLHHECMYDTSIHTHIHACIIKHRQRYTYIYA